MSEKIIEERVLKRDRMKKRIEVAMVGMCGEKREMRGNKGWLNLSERKKRAEIVFGISTFEGEKEVSKEIERERA